VWCTRGSSFASEGRAYDVTAVKWGEVRVCCMHMGRLKDGTISGCSKSNLTSVKYDETVVSRAA
jgi:hypothetical protein